MSGKTQIAIDGETFLLNGKPTYAGRTWNGLKIEGLLLNSRMVQGIYDDLNPETRSRWAYKDTGTWNPDRNTEEFVAAMPEWRRHGLLCVVVNLQGGSPEGYSERQPWHNSAYRADGSLYPAYLNRLGRILNAADDLGMVVMLGCFYFGQDIRLKDEAAVRAAVGNTARWVLEQGHTNVLLEIANECDVGRYTHRILTPPREHELVSYAKSIQVDGRRLLVSTSYRGRSLPSEELVRVADFLLLHGNHEGNPHRIAHMVRQTRATSTYTPKPILNNEDDHFDFDKPYNNLLASVGEYCSWGYFDPYADGYQSPPVTWSLNTPRKRAYFEKVKQITGA